MRLRLLVAVAGACLFAAVFGAQADAAPAGGLEGIPHYAHVFVLVLENEDESATWSQTGPAQYLNSLRSRGVFVPNYFATGHASLDNYIAMVSGQPDQPLSGSDCESVNLFTCVRAQSAMAGGRNLGDQLDDAHVSWKGYMDSMPTACFHADYSPTAGNDPYQGNSTAQPAGNYADRHNPFIYFADVIGNDARCRQHELPYTQLASDLRSGSLPQFGFITPDTCHDGHDAPCAGGQPGGLVSADRWLKQELPPLLGYLTSHDGLLLVTSDESGVDQGAVAAPGCCSGGAGGVAPGVGGQVGLLALAPGLKAGTVTTQYDHMSLLRTIEDSFGISEHLNNAASAAPMADVFASRAAAAAPSTQAPPAKNQVNAAEATGVRLAPTGWSPLAVALLGLALVALGSLLRRSGA